MSLGLMPQTPVLGAPHCPFLWGAGCQTGFAPLHLAGWVAGGTVGSRCTLWAELKPVFSAYSWHLLLYAVLRSWDIPLRSCCRGAKGRDWSWSRRHLVAPQGLQDRAGTVALAADVSAHEDAG